MNYFFYNFVYSNYLNCEEGGQEGKEQDHKVDSIIYKIIEERSETFLNIERLHSIDVFHILKISRGQFHQHFGAKAEQLFRRLMSMLLIGTAFGTNAPKRGALCKSCNLKYAVKLQQ